MQSKEFVHISRQVTLGIVQYRVSENAKHRSEQDPGVQMEPKQQRSEHTDYYEQHGPAHGSGFLRPQKTTLWDRHTKRYNEANSGRTTLTGTRSIHQMETVRFRRYIVRSYSSLHWLGRTSRYSFVVSRRSTFHPCRERGFKQILRTRISHMCSSMASSTSS